MVGITYPPFGSSNLANPTASVGLTAVNGSATTAMRADAAPPLDQSIAPTWTGFHRFNLNVGIGAAPLSTVSGQISLSVNNTTITNYTSRTTDFLSNAFWNGSNYIAVATGAAGRFQLVNDGSFEWRTAPSVSAGGTLTFGSATTISAAGVFTSALNIVSGGSISTQSGASSIFWAARTVLRATADGELQISNNSVSNASIISIPAMGTIQHGAANADTNAAIVAQVVRAQGLSSGGTSNQAGKDFTFQGSAGKGTGAGGAFIIQTTPAGSTGTAVNAFATGLTITAPAASQQPSVVVGNQALATNATDGFLYIAAGAGPPTGTPTGFTGRVPLYYDSTNNQLYVYNSSWLQPKTPAAAAVVTWQ